MLHVVIECVSLQLDIYTQINGRPAVSHYVCHQSDSDSSESLLIWKYKKTSSRVCVVKGPSLLKKGSSWYIGKWVCHSHLILILLGVLGTSGGVASGGGWGNYTVSATLHTTSKPPAFFDEQRALL